MKSRLLLTRAAASVLLLLPFAARAQSVGIGTTAPDASAALDVVSTTKGLLVPRVASVTALASPAPGLLVYQTGTPAGFYYNAGTAAAPGWQQVATAASAAAVAAFTATNGLTKTGQVVTFGGNLTSPVTILQAGNAFSLTDGNVGIGTATPQATLDTNGDFRVSNGTTGATLGTTGSAYANLNGALGQSFTMPVAGTVTSIRLVAGNNTFSTTFVLRSGAGPSGPALTTAQTINFTANASTTVALTTPVALAAGTYTIVLDAGSNQLRYFNGGENYTGGFVYVGTSSVSPYDMEFAVNYTTGTSTSAFYVGTGGNVGIGTTGIPGQRLDVTGGNIRIGTSGGGLIFPDGSTQTVAATTATGAGFIQNQTTQQTTSNFNISGAGTVGGTLTASSAAVSGALTGSGASIAGVGMGIRTDGGLNLGQNTTGNNLYVGFEAGRDNTTTGTTNQMVGYQAGQHNTTGAYNFMEGSAAGQFTTTGGGNFFMGWLAGQLGNGDRNLAIGMQAGRSNTSSDNHFVGFYAGNGTTTGSRNTFEGNYSGVYNTTGGQNTFVGYQAGSDNSTGSNNFSLGYMAGPASGSGALTNAGAIGHNARVSQSNSLVLGGTSGDALSVGIGTTAPSSTLQVAGTVAVGVVMNLAGNSAGTLLTGGGYLGLNPTTGNDYYKLPDAATCPGRIYYVRNNSSTNIAYVATNGGSIFEGGATAAATTPYYLQTSGLTKTLTIISDGTNWTFLKSGN